MADDVLINKAAAIERAIEVYNVEVPHDPLRIRAVSAPAHRGVRGVAGL